MEYMKGGSLRQLYGIKYIHHFAMHHYPSKFETPRRNYWKSKIPLVSDANSSINDYPKNYSPFAETFSPSSGLKQPKNGGKTQNMEIMRKTLHDKFRNIYESPNKSAINFEKSLKKCQSLVPENIIVQKQLTKEKNDKLKTYGSSAKTPRQSIKNEEYETRSNKSSRMVSLMQRESTGRNEPIKTYFPKSHEDVKEPKYIKEHPQKNINPKPLKYKEKKEKRVISNKDQRIPIEYYDKLYHPKHKEPKSGKKISSVKNLNIKTEDKESKKEIHSVKDHNEIYSNKASKADTSRSQPIIDYTRSEKLSDKCSECTKCSGCRKKGMEYVCLNCINKRLAAEKAKRRQLENTYDGMQDKIRAQEREEARKKYLEELISKKQTLNNEMLNAIKENEQKRKQEKSEE